MLTNHTLYNILTYAARKKIVLQWIRAKEPTVKGWHKVLFDLIPFEYLTCIVHYKSKQFYEILEPYLNYLDPNVSTIMFQGFS